MITTLLLKYLCDIKGPLFGPDTSVKVEFYQNVGSFTGWHAFIWRNWTWHLNSEVNHEKYAEEWTKEHQLELVRCASALSVIQNTAAKVGELGMGGYGYLGVCLDSVAICQYAVMKKTTIFPLLLCGQPRMLIINVARKIRAGMQSQNQNTSFEAVVTNIIRAIVNLSTDVDIPPKNICDALDRIEKSMPSKSIFSLVKISRKQASELREHLQNEYYSDSGTLKQPSVSVQL